MIGIDDLALGAQSVFSGLANSGIASAASALGSQFLQALSGDYFGRKQRSRQAELSYELANYEAALNYNYSQKYAEDTYALAQRYAENSAKWSVRGLRNAGLNPILAASHGIGASTVPSSPQGNASVSVPALSSNPNGIDLAESMRDFASFKSSVASAKNLDSQTSLNAVSKDLVKANAAKSVAEADSIRVKADSEALSTLLDALRQGDKSFLGTLFKVTSGHDDISKSALDAIDRITTRLGSRFGSNAKEVSNPSRVFHKVDESYPIRHSARRPDSDSSKSLNVWFTDHSKRSINDIDFERMYKMKR